MQRIFKGSNVHFVGIAGISMSALASIASELGARVSGSDIQAFDNQELLHKGISAYRGCDTNKLKTVNLLVYSLAVSEDNAELVYAKSKGIPIMKRSEFLCYIASLFDNTIAISGTHGKTSVTAMLTNVFCAAEASFSSHIGGISNNLQSNYTLRGYETFITEACEYKGAFRMLSSKLAVITNIEEEHLDCYKDLDGIYDAYNCFVQNIRSGGSLVVGDEVDLSRLRLPKRVSIFTYGISGCDFNAESIIQTKDKTEFDVMLKKQFLMRISIAQRGIINIKNALAATTAAYLSGIPPQAISQGLSAYSGVKRRQEFVTKLGNCNVFLDYAHHPTEIKGCMQIFEGQDIITVFEPHTYSRTKYLFDDFVEVLSSSCYTIVLPTYAAREEPEQGFDAFTLYKGLTNEKEYASTFELAKQYLEKLAQEKSAVILLLGAGSIVQLKNLLLSS